MKRLILSLVLSLAGGAAQAATLGLTPKSPTLLASGAEVDYLVFGSDGDLSMFGAVIDGFEGASPSGAAAMSFGIGFSQAVPTDRPGGGFDIFDETGLYLAGDLITLGHSVSEAGKSVVELLFGALSGSAADQWSDRVLMTVELSFGPDDPFSIFADQTSYVSDVRLQALDASVVPLPSSAILFLSGVLGLGLARRFRKVPALS